MTGEERKEAIEQLEIAKGLIEQNGEDYLDERDIPILNLAIEALQQQEEYVTKMDEVRRAYDNISKVQPCEDAVSRQAIEDAGFTLVLDCVTNTENHYIVAESEDTVSKLKQERIDVFDKLRAELHATAEMHEDGSYYIRDEWIDEYFDRYRS